MLRTYLKLRFLTVFFFMISCSSDETEITDLVGSWRLTEQLSDPGNGSGEFIEVESIKTITFKSDGNFESNGTMCNMNIFADEQSSGNYNTTSKIIYPDACMALSYSIDYFIEDNKLFLSYPCIELCQQKYTKND